MTINWIAEAVESIKSVDKYGQNETLLIRAQAEAAIAQAIAAERHAAALERIASVLESTRGMYGGIPFLRTSDSLGDDAPQMGD